MARQLHRTRSVTDVWRSARRAIFGNRGAESRIMPGCRSAGVPVLATVNMRKPSLGWKVESLIQPGNRAARQRSLSMLLDETELRGDGWQTMQTRSWRVGSLSGSSDAAKQAGKPGSFTA